MAEKIQEDSILGKELREAGGGKIGLEEFDVRAAGAEDSFSGEVPAADGAFHSGGPAGGGPIAGEEEARRICGLCRAEAVDARFGRKRGARFFDDRGFDEPSFTCRGKRLLNLLQANVDDFFAGLFEKVIRSTDDEL